MGLDLLQIDGWVLEGGEEKHGYFHKQTSHLTSHNLDVSCNWYVRSIPTIREQAESF